MANQGQVAQTQQQATAQDLNNTSANADWRVRLSLAPNSNYLYNDSTNNLLAPLAYTKGVIFPYTPNINITYAANYNATQPVHSNYKIFQYESSSVDTITITCDFTAQDTFEANYLLAVITFFKSVTKMFYGQDNNPKPGTPPPMCFLHGLGQFQFNNSPLAISNFTYNLPNDVDYIRATGYVTRNATSGESANLQNKATAGQQQSPFSTALNRLKQGIVSGLGTTALSLIGNKSLAPGGMLANNFNALTSPYSGVNEPTYVPTKINISITAVPIVSRYDVSNKFSLHDYANGELFKKGFYW